MNIDINNLKRKPLFPNSSKLNFNRVGYRVDNHPIIIFEYGNDVVFLTAQTAYYEDLKLQKLKENKLHKKLENEEMIIIKPNSAEINGPGRKGLFLNDSLVDTTSLFVMNKEDFNEVFAADQNQIYNTRKIDCNQMINLLQQLEKNIKNDKYTLNRIVLEKNKDSITCGTKTELIYTNKNLYLLDYEDKLKAINDKKWFLSQFEYTKNKVEHGLYNFDESKNILLDLVDKEIMSISGIRNCYQVDFDPYVYYAYENDDNITAEKLFGYTIDEISELDMQKQLETESFSDYEKDYYKQHPEEFKDKYETYLEKLKEAYFEYENKTKSKSSQNKINKCKDLDDDFELER